MITLQGVSTIHTIIYSTFKVVHGGCTGTGWLCSSDGLLITAGHLFLPELGEIVGGSTSVSVMDANNNCPYQAKMKYAKYDPENGYDFAVLELESTPEGACYLQIDASDSSSDDYYNNDLLICGFGNKVNTAFDSAIGKFEGGFLKNRNVLYKLKASDAKQEGFSGAAIFNLAQKKVIGIQIQQSISCSGANRDAVLAMPSYTILAVLRDKDPALVDRFNMLDIPRSISKQSSLSCSAQRLYDEIGNRKTAFPKDMSFCEIYDNDLFVHSKFIDSIGSELNYEHVNGIVLTSSVLILGEPGSGKSFFSYCLLRNNMKNNGIVLLPIDLRELYEADITPSVPEVMKQLNCDSSEKCDRFIFIIDGVDEFCGTNECDTFCREIITNLSSFGKLCVLCRRYEFDLYISNIINVDLFAKVLSVKEWEVEKEFKQYLDIIANKENIDANETYALVASSTQLLELIKRPLHTRMLIYIITIKQISVDALRSFADLYEQYFACLSASIKGYTSSEVIAYWRNLCWKLFAKGFDVNRKIDIAEIRYLFPEIKNCERIISPIVNWSTNLSSQAFTFLHYSFYEFLVAYYFATELSRTNANIKQRRVMFLKDFTLEIRHYSVLLLRNLRDASFWVRLVKLYINDTSNSDDSENTKRRVSNNLLLYFISRVSSIDANTLISLLNSEQDLFLRTSLYWAMCNLDHRASLIEYLNQLSDSMYAELNRGYLLYYYGDIDQNLSPPYLDHDPYSRWEKTRLNNMRMFQDSNYCSISSSRKLLDVYTFVDLAYFHKTKLDQEEYDCLCTIINAIQVQDKFVQDALCVTRKYLKKLSDVETNC